MPSSGLAVHPIPHPPHGILARLVRLLKFFGKELQIYLLCSLAVGVFLSGVELAFSYIVQAFLLKVGAANPNELNLPPVLMEATLFMVLAALTFTGLLRAVFQGLKQYLAAAIVETYQAVQRMRLLRWVFSSRSVNTAEIMLLFNERVNRSSGAVGSIQQAVILFTSSTILFGSLLLISPKVTLVGTFALGVLGLSLRKIDRYVSRVSEGLASDWTAMNERLILSIKNLLLIQIYGTEAKEERLTREGLQKCLKHGLDFGKLYLVKSASPQFAGLLIICGIAYFNMQSGGMRGAMMLTYFYLFLRFAQSFAELGANLSNLVLAAPQLRSLTDWWDRHGQADSIPLIASKTAAPAVSAKASLPAVGWSLTNVAFSYGPDFPSIISGLDLRLDPGKWLVIVGPSGRGKTTLLNLLIGALDPTAGKIELLDGSARALPLSENRDRLFPCLGYVGPESFLIEGSIRENLLYGQEDRAFSEGEILEALEMAECHFIREFKDGIHHRVSEQGHGLSAGQKQRLALARALLRKPKALILDEATANLDTETEMRLIQSLQALKGKITIVAVTHREAMLTVADQVLRV